MGIAPSPANLEGVRAKQGRKNEGPSSALLQRYITLLTHFGDPATDLDSFACPPERSSATLKWSVAEEPSRGSWHTYTLGCYRRHVGRGNRQSPTSGRAPYVFSYPC